MLTRKWAIYMNVNKEHPFFSIIIPIYNVEKYLNRCIESVINQSFSNFEIILVDDESPDNCPSICDEWIEKDKRIKVIHKKNEGLGYARNSGLKLASGKYVWFVDSDDVIAEESLKEIYIEISKCNPDFVSFGYKSINKDNKVLLEQVPNPNQKFYVGNKKIIDDLLPHFIGNFDSSKHFNMSACMCCIKLDFLKKNKLFFVSERDFISEDFYFYIEMFKFIESILFISKPFYYYYYNGSSLTNTYSSDRLRKTIFFYKTMDDLVEKYNYGKKCKIAFQYKFISSLISILKMEIKNRDNVGLKKSYDNFKDVCMNEYVVNTLKSFNDKNNSNWNLLKFLILKQKFLILYLLLFIKSKQGFR